MEDQTFSSFGRDLRKEISAYIEARIEYGKLVAYEKMAKAMASATSVLILAAFGFFTFFFISITLALYLGRWLNDELLGFAIVSGFDLLIFILFLSFKEKIEQNMMQKIVEQLLKEKQKDENSSHETTGKTTY